MITLPAYTSLLEEIQSHTFILIYFSTLNCCICRADMPRVEKLVQDYDVPAYHVIIDHMKEASGQFSVFTAPTVLLLYNGREYHRQSRIMDFIELEKRIKEIHENLSR